MARIDEGMFKNWANGDRMNPDDYKRERELLRAAVNDVDDKVQLLDPQNVEGIKNEIEMAKGDASSLEERFVKNEDNIGDVSQIEQTNIVDALKDKDEKLTDINNELSQTNGVISSIQEKLTWVNASDYETVGEAFEALSENGIIQFDPNKEYVMSGDFTVKNKSIEILGNNAVISGSGSIILDCDLSGYVSANTIKKGDYVVKSSLSVNVNDYIEVKGDITHDLYAPYRYNTTKIIAKVIAVDSANQNITLDRNIQFNLSNVTVAVLLKPLRLNVTNLQFNGTQLAVNHCVNGNISTTHTGNRGTGSGISVLSSCDIRLRVTANEVKGNFGLLMNDLNNFDVNYISVRVGHSDGTGTKSLRGNGLQNGNIVGIFTNSMVCDSTIYGSRNVTCDMKSIGNGKYFRENNIKTSNRVEAVQFSECDSITVYADMDQVDDQGVEFLSCVNSTLHPKINTLDTSTEGAIVIKGVSRDVTIINPVIRCYNDYGIKLECLNGLTDVKIINPDIWNYKTGFSGIQVRDSTVVSDVNVRILGGIIKAYSPITIAANHNNVSVDNVIVESLGTHGITSLSDFLKVNKLKGIGCNDITIRAVVSSGANDVVNNVDSDGAVYVRDQARAYFNIKRYLNNKVSRIFIDTDNYSIYCSQGLLQIDVLPTKYSWDKGVTLYKRNPVANDYIGYINLNDGNFTTNNPTFKGFGLLQA